MSATRQLLEKEQEYLHLNQQLESTTRDILKQAEEVMKTSGFSDYQILEAEYRNTHSRRESKTGSGDSSKDRKPIPKLKKVLPEGPALDKEAKFPIIDAKYDDGLIDKEKVSDRGMVKYLKTKNKLLEDQLSELQAEHKTQVELNGRLLEAKKQLTDQYTKSSNQNNSLKIQISKHESNLQTATARVQHLEKENLTLNKELEKSNADARMYKLNNTTVTGKLHKANELVDSLKQEVKSLIQKEREGKDTTRKMEEKLRKQLMGGIKQKEEFLNAVAHQIALIENLKKQNDFLYAAQLGDRIDKEFRDLLDLFCQELS